MDEKLKEGYTLYLSFDSEKNVKGGYLRRVEDGLWSCPLVGNEVVLVDNFPNILTSLEEGRTLQMYRSGYDMITAMLGRVTFEGPYGEIKCLDQAFLAYHSGSIPTLMELDAILEKNKENPMEYKKAYRLYGSDKYLFYTREFISENLEG